jgi:hypothetical protein
MKSPILLFSLRHGGSTLIQRVLISHKNIATVAEAGKGKITNPYFYFDV